MAQFTAIDWTSRVVGRISGSRWESGLSFARNVAVLSGGTALAQGLNALLAPALTRLYPPENLGQFALFTSFLNVALVGVSLKYELAVLAVRTQRKAAKLALAAFLFAVPMSVLGAAVLFFLIHSSILGFNALPAYASPLMVFASVFGAAFLVFRCWFVRQEQFNLVSQATVVQSGVRSVCQVAMGSLGLEVGGLLAGEVIGRCAGMSRMFREAWPTIRSWVFPIDRESFCEVLRENWRFPILSFPSSVVDSLAANICIPLIVFYYGAEAGGYFALVHRVLLVPLVLVSASVADAFHGRLALYARDVPDRVIQLFRNTSAWLVGLGVIPATLLFSFGEPLFRMVFGSRWAMAGKFAAVVAPLFLAQFIVSPLSRLVFVLGGQCFKLIYDVLALASMVGVFLYSARHHLSLLQAITLLSVTGTLTYVIYYLVLIHITRQYRRIQATRVHESST